MKNLADEKDVWREKMQRNKWNIQRIHSFYRIILGLYRNKYFLNISFYSFTSFSMFSFSFLVLEAASMLANSRMTRVFEIFSSNLQNDFYICAALQLLFHLKFRNAYRVTPWYPKQQFSISIFYKISIAYQAIRESVFQIILMHFLRQFNIIQNKMTCVFLNM